MASERRRELRRRRTRRRKMSILKRKSDAATASEKTVVANKLRALTPGAEVIIERWGLADR